MVNGLLCVWCTVPAMIHRFTRCLLVFQLNCHTKLRIAMIFFYVCVCVSVSASIVHECKWCTLHNSKHSNNKNIFIRIYWIWVNEFFIYWTHIVSAPWKLFFFVTLHILFCCCLFRIVGADAKYCVSIKKKKKFSFNPTGTLRKQDINYTMLWSVSSESIFTESNWNM